MINLIRALIFFIILEAMVAAVAFGRRRAAKPTLARFTLMNFLRFVPIAFLGSIIINDILILGKTPNLEALVWATLTYLLAGLWLSRGIMQLLVFLVAVSAYYIKSGIMSLPHSLDFLTSITLSIVSVWFFINFTMVAHFFDWALAILATRLSPTILLGNFFHSSFAGVPRPRALTLVLLFSGLVSTLSLFSLFYPEILSLWTQPLIGIALGMLLAAAKVYDTMVASMLGELSLTTIAQIPMISDTLTSKQMRAALSALIIGFLISWLDPTAITSLAVRLAPFIGILIGAITIGTTTTTMYAGYETDIEWLQRAQMRVVQLAIGNLPGDIQSRLWPKWHKLNEELGQVPTTEWDKSMADLLAEIMLEARATPLAIPNPNEGLVSLRAEVERSLPQVEEVAGMALAVGFSKEDLSEKFRLLLQSQIPLAMELWHRGMLQQEDIKNLHSYFMGLQRQVHRLHREASKRYSIVSQNDITMWIPRNLKADDISWFAISIPTSHNIDDFDIEFISKGLEKIEKAELELEEVKRGSERSMFRGVLKPVTTPPKQVTLRAKVKLSGQDVFDSGHILAKVRSLDATINNIMPVLAGTLVPVFQSIVTFVLIYLGYPSEKAQLGGLVGIALLFIVISAILKMRSR